MVNKNSKPVYVPVETINGLKKYLKTPEGQKLSTTNINKLINYILTKFLAENN